MANYLASSITEAAEKMETNITLTTATLERKVPLFSQDIYKRAHSKHMTVHKQTIAKRRADIAAEKIRRVDAEETRVREKVERREKRRRDHLDHVLDRSVVLRKKIVDNPASLELVDIDEIKAKNESIFCLGGQLGVLITLLEQLSRHLSGLRDRQKEKILIKLIRTFLQTSPINRKLELKYKENEKISVSEAKEDKEKKAEIEKIMKNFEFLESDALKLLLNKGMIDKNFAQKVLDILVNIVLYSPVDHTELNPLPDNDLAEYKDKLTQHKKWTREQNQLHEKLGERIRIIQVPKETWSDKEMRFCALFRIFPQLEGERKYKEELPEEEEQAPVELSESFFDYSKEDALFKAKKEEEERIQREKEEAERRKQEEEEAKEKRKKDIEEGLIEEEVEQEDKKEEEETENKEEKEEKEAEESKPKAEEKAKEESKIREEDSEEEKPKEEPREAEILSFMNNVEVLTNQALEKEVYVLHEGVLDEYKIKTINNFILQLPKEIYKKVKISEELALHNETEKELNKFAVRHLRNYRKYSKFQRDLLYYELHPPKPDSVLEEHPSKENSRVRAEKEDSRNESKLSANKSKLSANN